MTRKWKWVKWLRSYPSQLSVWSIFCIDIYAWGSSVQEFQNVGAGGPHHRPHQLMASFSLDCHRLVEWGRHNELEASMVGASSSHVLRSLVHDGCRGHSVSTKNAFVWPLRSKIWPILTAIRKRFCVDLWRWMKLVMGKVSINITIYR